MMEYAAARHLDRMIIVNKIDAQGVDLAGLLARDPGRLRPRVPAAEPAGRRRHAGGRLLLQPRRAAADFGVGRRGAPRAGRAGGRGRRRLRRALPRTTATSTRSELHAPLEQALREGHLIPVCFVSARTGAGVAELLDVIVKLLPNPTEGNPPEFLKGEGADAEPMQAEPDPAQHVLAHVFKVTVDPYVGKMGIFRVHQGTVTQGQPALHRRRPQAVQGRPPVHAAGQGPRRGAARACRATSARSPRSTRSTSTPCCTTRPRTTTST